MVCPSNGIWRAHNWQTMVWLGHQMAFGVSYFYQTMVWLGGTLTLYESRQVSWPHGDAGVASRFNHGNHVEPDLPS